MLNIELLKNTSFQHESSFIIKVNFVLQHENYGYVNYLPIIREKTITSMSKPNKFVLYVG